MSRILAFDYGKKRTGIAVTDELQLIASGLTTVNTDEIYKFVSNYLKDNEVQLFLVGEPKQMDYTPSESEVLILPFIAQLEKRYPLIPIKRVDERFTSKLAVRTMIDSGLKKNQRQNKALVDEISACILLQTYLYNQ